jgi:molybdenum cofactor cytidylyltransferase
MRLAEALRIQPGTSAAFIGAGGKSSALRKLVEELEPQCPVLLTTTTHLAKGQSDLARHHLVLNPGDGPKKVLPLLEIHRTVLVTGPLDGATEKWVGLPPDLLGAVWEAARGQPAAGSGERVALLIEADGARGRSWKAPAPHEPVVPDWIDLVVPMVGLDVIGQSADSDLTHRSELVQKQLGIAPSDSVSAKDVAKLLASPGGGLQGVPVGSKVRVLLNKVDTESRLAAARQIAGDLIRSERVAAVVIGAVRDTPPAVECWGRVAGVILAGGGSSRLGQPKQLVAWRGRVLVWHAARAAIDAGLSPVVVVTGAEADGVAAALRDEPVELVYNPRWQSGQSTSVLAGLEAVEGRAEAVCFLLADMPRIPPDLIRREVDAHRRTLSPIIAPWAGGRWANPALFDRSVFDSLRSLRGDRGGRTLFDRYPVLRIEWDDAILLDVDTPDDLAALERGS